MAAVGKNTAKLVVFQRFITSQLVVVVFGLLLGLVLEEMLVLFAVFLAAVLQWIQAYFLCRPYRVSRMGQWVGGMVAAAILKYLLLALAVLALFLTESVSLLSGERLFIVFAVYAVVYGVPFWSSGIRLARRGREDTRNVSVA